MCMKKDLISFAIIAYNQEDYVGDAIDASYTQSYRELEIIISDDCSSDSTYEVIKNSIQPHQSFYTAVNRNSLNQGINAHVNTVQEHCNGRFIVISAGDDISMPNRVDKLAEAWHAGAFGVFSNAEIIDAQGNKKGLFMHKGYDHFQSWKEMIVAGSHGAWGSTFSWDKKAFDLFGPLPLNILGEDATIPFRCALLGGVAYIDEVLVHYRDHGNNVSFWSQIKKTSGKALIKLGEKTIQFDLTMYQNWRVDIRTANLADLITAADVEWAEERLSAHENIRNIELEILQQTFGLAVLQCIKALWQKRVSKDRVMWGKRLIGTFLRFRTPLLYRGLKYIKGINFD